ncbi:hypothetical protein [Desmonostoc muscorum]|uniref:hypothetical protein n=1 Tax=Desmonostoc muscorum TaxID=1179 RepID=UPI001F2EE286|nr:hypothetical protein [Desmonostoc muscorum]MDZ8059523.1 hypothetical protein [Nostoc sp. EkiNYC01]
MGSRDFLKKAISISIARYKRATIDKIETVIAPAYVTGVMAPGNTLQFLVVLGLPKSQLVF